MHTFLCKKTNNLFNLQDDNQKQEDLNIKQVNRENFIEMSDFLEEGELVDLFEAKGIVPNSENTDQKEVMKWDTNTEQEQQENDQESQRELITKKDKEQQEEIKPDRGKEYIAHTFCKIDIGGNIFDKNGQKIYQHSQVSIKSVWTCNICGRSARGHLNHTCLYCFSPL